MGDGLAAASSDCVMLDRHTSLAVTAAHFNSNVL